MAIVGIASLLYGVEDVKQSTRFFIDFGLPIEMESATESRFRLDEGSTIVIRKLDDPSIPRSAVVGAGVREVVWGIDTQDSLNALVADLCRDREVTIDDSGGLHWTAISAPSHWACSTRHFFWLSAMLIHMGCRISAAV